MPFDTLPSARPYMREGTAALAALVATRPARDVLILVAAELQHRDRPAARRLRDEVAAMLGAAPVVMPAAEVVPCIHGDLAPEAREVVVEVLRVAATDAPAKPARKAARAERQPGDIGWKPPSLETLIKRSGNPALVFSPEIAGAFGNPIKAARWEALKAEGWQQVDDRDGYQILAHGDARLKLGHHGMLYCGTTWVQLDKAERDRLTDAGRPLLERLARISAAREALSAALSRRAALVKAMPKARMEGKIPANAWRLNSAKAEAGCTWRALQSARRALAEATAS